MFSLKKNSASARHSEFHYELALIPAGSFLMGAYHGAEDEKPVHNVMLSAFFLGKYEVTQKLWFAVMGTKPWQNASFVQEGENYPAVMINWYDAQEFIKKISRLEDKRFRLPSEAEWEYACLPGLKGHVPFRRYQSKLARYAWYYGNAFKKGIMHPQEVGGKRPNRFGLYDMMGNVYEWCSDWYSRDYYHKSVFFNPPGPMYGEFRVVRGGDWTRTAYFLRPSARCYHSPHTRDCCVGLRLALDAGQEVS